MFILDIETTGLDGLNSGDKIVEVGVCRLNRYGEVRPVYHSIVYQPDIMDHKNAWVFNNSTLTPEAVLKDGRPEEEVINSLHKILDGRFCTSYNTAFDYLKFVCQPPYNLRPIVPFDIMDLAAAAFGLNRHIHAEEAYLKFCPSDPAAIGGKEPHRALEDSVMEAFLLSKLLDY